MCTNGCAGLPFVKSSLPDMPFFILISTRISSYTKCLYWETGEGPVHRECDYGTNRFSLVHAGSNWYKVGGLGAGRRVRGQSWSVLVSVFASVEAQSHTALALSARTAW